MDRYPVVILDRPIRIFDFKPLPLLCLIAATLVALKLSSYIDSNILIGQVPANILFFLITYSLIVGHVKALELRPLKWWLRRIRYMNEPLPAYLPGHPMAPVVNFATIPRAESVVRQLSSFTAEIPPCASGFSPPDYCCHCLKINNKDLVNLDGLQRLKIADSIVDFASEQNGGVQIYSPPDWNGTEERDFYIIIKAPVGERSGHAEEALPQRLQKLMRKLDKLGLALEPVDKAALRQLLFAQLSPSHLDGDTTGDARLFMPTASDDDLLSLCVAGFEHHPRYIHMDEKYVSTVHLDNLPREINFGAFSRLLDAECHLAFSMYLRPCNLPALKRQARLNLKLGTTIKAYGPITPPEHLSQIKTFCETEIGATDIGISATIYADSLKRLEQNLRMVERAVHRMGGTISNSFNEELESLIAALPICEDRRHNSHVITSPAAAKFVPFL